MLKKMLNMIEIIEKQKVGESFYELRNTATKTEKTLYCPLAEKEYKEKKYYLLYNSHFEVIHEIYDYANHDCYIRSDNSLKKAMYAFRFLYIFSEIIEKKPIDFNYQDVTGLAYFLKGESYESDEYSFQLKTIRSNATINSYMSIYRKYFERMGEMDSIFFKATFTDRLSREKRSTSFISKQFPTRGRKESSVPKYISEQDFKKIIEVIRNSNESDVIKKRNECIVRIMYEGGCRIGEVLGCTVEDFEVQDVENSRTGEIVEVCFMNIRNRITDKLYQSAKTCMNIIDRNQYNSKEYKTKGCGCGYQTTFLSIDLYDLLCDYIDTAHREAEKKHKNRYKTTETDAVAAYKKEKMKNHYVFLNKKGSCLSENSWDAELRDIFKEAGIPLDYGTKKNNLNHRFRHGFVMRLIKLYGADGQNVETSFVMQRSRHISYSAFQMYFNPTDEELVQMKLEIEDMQGRASLEFLNEEIDTMLEKEKF